MPATNDVLDQHLKCFGENDLDFAKGSFASTQKSEIVRKLANAVRARQRPCAPPAGPSSTRPLGLTPAATNTDVGLLFWL